MVGCQDQCWLQGLLEPALLVEIKANLPIEEVKLFVDAVLVVGVDLDPLHLSAGEYEELAHHVMLLIRYGLVSGYLVLDHLVAS